MKETPALTRMNRRAFVRLGLGLSGAALLAACTPAAPSPTAAPAKPAAPAATAAPAKPAATAAPAKAAAPTKTLKFGAAISATGALTREGGFLREGYQFWADTVNAAGGIKVGNDAYKIELVFLDDQSDGATSAKLVEKLITEDKVDFLFGPMGSGITEVASVVSERYRKIMLSPLASTQRLFDRGFKYLFNHTSPIEKLGGLHAEMWKLLGVKTAAIVTPDDVYPLASANVQKAIAEQGGVQVVYFQKFPKDTHDMSSMITDMKRLAPEAVSVTGYVENELLLIRQAREQGVNFKYYGLLDAPSTEDFFQIMAKDANYMFEANPWDPSIGWKDPVFGDSKKFAADYKAKKGKEPTLFQSAAAASGVVLQQALMKAGSTDTDKVREAMLALDLQTLNMPLKYNEKGQNIAGTAVVLQVQDGKRTVVYPDSVAAAKPKYPTPPWGQR
ncbi:MAG: amino acid ABC transporter substrate-binding protein [Chloroflexi bacterium]|nr:amino acid ABC transporter substrate-binding protein [Chloroflexota bacterium]